MADEHQGELHLACVHCRRVVSVTFDRGAVAHGETDATLTEHRTCYVCGRPMVETTRDICSHVIIPGEQCMCPDAVKERARRAAP